MTETAIYLYCVVEMASPRSRGRVPAGVPGASRPALLDIGRGRFAVVSEVPLDTYGPEGIEQGLQNLEWVAGIALAHEAVAEHFAARRGATVVPMSLLTMFSTEERVVADLRAKQQVLTAALRRVRGCVEWGLRAVQAPVRSSKADPAMAPPASSGAAFLAAKKRARNGLRESSRHTGEAVEGAFVLLARLSRDSRRRTDVPEGGTAPPLLDAAFLVPLARQTRFRAAAKRASATCRAANVRLTLSGPWPPYNFVRPGGHA